MLIHCDAECTGLISSDWPPGIVECMDVGGGSAAGAPGPLLVSAIWNSINKHAPFSTKVRHQAIQFGADELENITNWKKTPAMQKKVGLEEPCDPTLSSTSPLLVNRRFQTTGWGVGELAAGEDASGLDRSSVNPDVRPPLTPEGQRVASGPNTTERCFDRPSPR